MKVRVSPRLLTLCALLLLTPGLHAGSPAPWRMTVQTDKPGAKISPYFYGLMTEEINHAYDGGLYAELIQNRVFKDNDTTPIHWSLVQDGGGAGSLSLDKSDPVNPALTTSLKMEVTAAGTRVGVANEGFCNYSKERGGRVADGPGGLPVKPDTAYQVTFYAKAQGAGPLTVSLESNDGKTIHAHATADGVTGSWKKFNLTLKTGAGVTPSLDNRFVVSTNQPGTVWLSYVSLFPPTYKNRPNGNRVDLSEKLAAMKPGFLRFPGGNYVDPGHYIWKNTIGPVETRPGNPGAWKYRTSEGLGLLEFFLWCEDLGMEPLLAVTVGRPWLAANGDVTPLVQDALDEIEYATGDAATTTWGAKRAADGHPAPFTLRWVEIGNEDVFDKRETYEARFTRFYDAIKAKHPQIKIIATRRDVHARVPDLCDDHIYATAPSMARAGAKYDEYSRQAPKIFVGEWATQDGKPTPNMRGALGDAAYLTGLERNADVIEMACYAPLFTSVLPNGSQWPTNLIGYDALNSFGSPSYYMQAMFSHNKGDAVLPVDLRATGAPADRAPTPPPPPHGGVGFGTYRGQAEFKDVSVSTGTTTLFQSGAAIQPGDWQTPTGRWTAKPDGSYAQSDDRPYSRALTKAGQDWTDYTYTLKARKTGGREGFLIYFHVKDERNFIFWNLGAAGNTHSGVEQTIDDDKQEIDQPESVTIETGRWYDIKIEVRGRDIRCFLDGKLISETSEAVATSLLPVYTSATHDDATGDVILKVVNMSRDSQRVEIHLAGLAKAASQATVEVLAGEPDAVNTIAEPMKVAPKTETIPNVGETFERVFPAHSVSVIRVKG